MLNYIIHISLFFFLLFQLEFSNVSRCFPSELVSKMKSMYYKNLCRGIEWTDENNLLLSASIKDVKRRMTKLAILNKKMQSISQNK